MPVEQRPGRDGHGCRWSGGTSVAVRDAPRGEGNDGYQGVGGESRPTEQASDDEGVGDVVANPCVQDRRKDVRDHAQDGKSGGNCGEGKCSDAHEKGNRSAGQVDEGSGESHDSRHVEPRGGRPPRGDEEGNAGQGGTEQERRPLHIGYCDEAINQDRTEDDSVNRGGHRGTA